MPTDKQRATARRYYARNADKMRLQARLRMAARALRLGIQPRSRMTPEERCARRAARLEARRLGLPPAERALDLRVKQANNRLPLNVLKRMWSNIRRRCLGLDPKTPQSWGLPFVTHDEFLSWATANPEFWRLYGQWVDHRYARVWSVSVDRISDHGGYTFGNMQFLEFCRNQAKPRERQERQLTLKGRTQSLNAWAHELGINPRTLNSRLTCRGWSVEKTLTTPCVGGNH